jgi:hypothetical protein
VALGIDDIAIGRVSVSDDGDDDDDAVTRSENPKP